MRNNSKIKLKCGYFPERITLLWPQILADINQNFLKQTCSTETWSKKMLLRKQSKAKYGCILMF